MLHSWDEHKDESSESTVLMAWIKFQNRKRKPVQIWEIELMIQQIREDIDLMIRIGKEQGWIKELK
jgi:hypothetical protein